MERRVFTLTNVLAVALVVAVATLSFVIYRDYLRGEDVEVGERTRRANSSRPRERGIAPPNAGSEAAVARDEPEADPAKTRPAVDPSTLERRGATASAEVRRLSNAADDAAPALTGRNDTSHWYSADVTPVIAHLLLQFALASQWPDEVLTNRSEFTIGILRDDSLRVALVAGLRNETVAGRPIVVLNRDHPEALVACPVVFVGDVLHATDALAAFAGRSIMSVTYTGASLDDTWCDIELIWSERQVGFVVDRKTLARNRITVGDALFGFERALIRDETGQAVRLPGVRAQEGSRPEIAKTLWK